MAVAAPYTGGMRKEPTVKVTVRLPESVVAALREVADRERRSFTATLLVAAERYLAQDRAQQRGEAGDARA